MSRLGKFSDAFQASSASNKVKGSSIFLGNRLHIFSWMSSARSGLHRTKDGKAPSRSAHSAVPAMHCVATGAEIGSTFAQSPGPRVCILGGGFGGLYTAVRLHSLLWPQGKRPQVTLVDKSDRFVFKPLLYEFVNGAATLEEVAPPFSKLLAPYNVHFIQAGVQSVEPADPSNSLIQPGGCVVLDKGPALEYDWLVLSLGSEATTMGVPGAKEHAFVFNSINDALQVQRRVDQLAHSVSSQVAVVGSGPAGVELSATVAERLAGRARVQLISTGPEILKGVPVPHRAAAEETLLRKGVTVIRNTLVTKVKESRVGGAAGGVRRLVELKDVQGNVRVGHSALQLRRRGIIEHAPQCLGPSGLA